LHCHGRRGGARHTALCVGGAALLQPAAPLARALLPAPIGPHAAPPQAPNEAALCYKERYEEWGRRYNVRVITSTRDSFSDMFDDDETLMWAALRTLRVLSCAVHRMACCRGLAGCPSKWWLLACLCCGGHSSHSWGASAAECCLKPFLECPLPPLHTPPHPTAVAALTCRYEPDSTAAVLLCGGDEEAEAAAAAACAEAEISVVVRQSQEAEPTNYLLYGKPKD
jgi:hypothetical protein